MHIGHGACRVRGNHPGGSCHETTVHVVIHHNHGAIGHGQKQPIRCLIVSQIPGISRQGSAGKRRGITTGSGAIHLHTVTTDIGGHHQACLMGNGNPFQGHGAGRRDTAVQGGNIHGTIRTLCQLVQHLQATGSPATVVGGIKIAQQVQRNTLIGIGIERALHFKISIQAVDFTGVTTAIVHHQQ